ncbi:MAG TPA: O-antigen ligase family protein [Candidatus Paceibacterota bacterium]
MNNTNITKALRSVALLGIFIIPFIPLYVANGLFFPFITGKAFIFRIVIEIVFAIWLILILRDRSYAPKSSKIFWSITAFTVIIFIADLFGLNSIRSMWSNFERMEGWVTIAHLWAYFVALTSIFGANGESESRRTWHRFFNVSIIAAGIVAVYGLFQILGIADVHQGSTRVDASLGNAAYMAVYMLIHIFLTVYMGIVHRNNKNKSFSTWYFIFAIFFSFILFETATRGTILGFIGGIMLILALYSVFGKGETKKSRIISTSILALIILTGVLFYLNRDASFIQKNETLGRLATISIRDTKTQARGYIWPMAVDATFQNTKTALIGYGQENFNYIFNGNYNPKMWNQEQWFDRAHSVFLDWLVAGGLLGLLSYILLFVLAFIYVWKSSLTFGEKCVFTGLFAAYAVHNIFVFDNLISYILFFTTLGFVHSESSASSIRFLQIGDNQSENKIIVRDYIYVPIIILLFLATLYFVNIRVIQANKRLITAMSYCSGNATPSADLYARALKMDQYTAKQEIREQLINCANGVISSGYPEPLKNSFYNLVKIEVENQIKDTPNDARIYVLAGSFYNNIRDFTSAESLLLKAKELSPKKQSIIFELASVYMNTPGKEKEALALMKEAYESAPENGTSKIGYIATLILTGNEKEALTLFGSDPDLFLDERIISVYARLKEYNKVINAYEALIKKDPTKITLYGSLATAYVLKRDREGALHVLREALKKFPEAKTQIEEAIKQVETGKLGE